MKKLKDPILLGIMAGLAGNLLKDLGNLFTTKKGMNDLTYSSMAGSLYMKKKDTKSNLGKKVGFLADMAVGAGLGVGYIYVLKFTGKDHALMKGVGYGHGAWTLLLGGTNKLGASKIFPLKPKTVLSNYLEHTLYGLGAYLVASKFGDDDLYAKEDIEQPQVSQTSTLQAGKPDVTESKYIQ